LAIGTGPGAEERRSIAVVVIGGQSLSLLLTLIATPVVYSLLDDMRGTSRWRALATSISRYKEGVLSKVRRPRRPADKPIADRTAVKTGEDSITTAGD
jgi:AcrB/AcrD/AcrF family protein